MSDTYGVPTPRGVRKDWEATSMEPYRAGLRLQARFVPESWGDPTACVAWWDRFGRVRVMVGHYANGRSALVRTDANGKWKTTFGQVAAPVDATPRKAEGFEARRAGSAVTAKPAGAPSPEFVALTRDPNLPAPTRWEPTPKKPGEFVLGKDGLIPALKAREQLG